MFKFLIKKFFFLVMDHLYILLFLNFLYLLVLLAGVGLFSLMATLIPSPTPVVLFLGIACVLLLSNLFLGATAGILNEMNQYGEPRLRNFWRYLKSSLINSCLFTLAGTLLLFLSVNALSFYLSSTMRIAPVAVAFIIWLMILWGLAAQFFYAIHYRLEKNFFKILKKMVLLFLDNVFFTLFCSLWILILTVLTVPTLFMLPGLVSLQLFCLIAVTLRLHKYEYLEKQAPASPRPPVPWKELIQEDMKKLGPRSLRSTFFPWKK